MVDVCVHTYLCARVPPSHKCVNECYWRGKRRLSATLLCHLHLHFLVSGFLTRLDLIDFRLNWLPVCSKDPVFPCSPLTPKDWGHRCTPNLFFPHGSKVLLLEQRPLVLYAIYPVSISSYSLMEMLCTLLPISVELVILSLQEIIHNIIGIRLSHMSYFAHFILTTNRASVFKYHISEKDIIDLATWCWQVF